MLDFFRNRPRTRSLCLPLVLYFSIALFASRGILVTAGTIGLFHDWFVGPFPEMIAKYSSAGLQLLDVNFENKIYPSDWLFRVLLTPFAFWGGEAVSKVMLVVVMTLSGLFMFFFGRTSLKLGYYWSLISGLIYFFSPIVFTKSVAGHIYYMVGYALAPLLLLFFSKAQEDEKKFHYAVASGLLFGVIGVQIQFFVMTFIILVILVLVDFKRVKNGLSSLTLTTIIGSLLHLPWILPLVLTPPAAVTSVTQTFLSYHEILNSPTLSESIRVIGYNIQPYSYTRLTGQGIIPGLILIADFVMPVIAAVALIGKKNKYTISFGLILVIGIFLSKGTSPPLENIFILIFEYTPLIIFRELWHIAFLTFFSYTILTSISLQEITKALRSRFHGLKAYGLTFILVTIMIVSNGYPLLLGNFAGFMQTYSLDDDYTQLFNWFQNDHDQYRILWLPSISPVKYDNKSLNGEDPLIAFSPKPTFDQRIDPASPLSKTTMFLASTIHENQTRRFGRLIGPFATTYAILRKDFTSEFQHYVPLALYPELRERWEPEITNDFIMDQQDLQLINATQNFRLYRNAVPSEFIYAPKTIVYGSEDLSTLTNLAELTNLGDIAYLTETTHLETKAPIFIVKNDGADLIPMVTGTKIDPGNYATETDARTGWVNSKSWFWYNYLFASGINNGAFTTTNSSLTIPVKTTGSAEIWAKILKWPQGSQIRFMLNQEKEVITTTLSKTFTLQWVKLYEDITGQSHELEISNTEGENYVDEILVLEKDQVERALTSDLENATIIYVIDPRSFETNLAMNPSFEKTQNYYPDDWHPAEEGFTATVDRTAAYEGNVSLRVTTKLDSSWHWSWVRSSEISAVPGEYQIVTHVKQENAEASHVAIDGLNEATGQWIQLTQVPVGQNGTSDWKACKGPLRIDANTTRLRIALNAGWIADKAQGNATTWFDDIWIVPMQRYSYDCFLPANTTITRTLEILKEDTYRISAELNGNIAITFDNLTIHASADHYATIDLGSVNLRNSNHNLKIRALENTHLGNILISNTAQGKSIRESLEQIHHKARIIEYKQDNPSLWKISANASTPFLLAFAAPYDSGWQAKVQDKAYGSIPLYGFINGFWVNQTGLLDITIEYEPQRWFNYGLVISLTTVLACLTYLTYSCSKEQDLVNRIKAKLPKLRRRTQLHIIHLKAKRCEHANSRRTSSPAST